MSWLCHDPRNSNYLKPVCRPYENIGAVELRCDGEKIHVRSRLGAVLETIALKDITWRPCALPGRDHCLSLQFKVPQARELVFKARSQKIVAQLTSILDTAAEALPERKSSSQPPSEISLRADARPTTSEKADCLDHQSKPKKDSEVEEESASSPKQCPRCLQLAELLEDHEAHLQQGETLHAELASCKEALKTAERERDEQTKSFLHAEERCQMAEQGQASALIRCKTLEKRLEEAVHRRDELAKKMAEAMTATQESESHVSKLEGTLSTIEEEKKLLIAALTSAQAQLHDLSCACKQTSAELEEVKGSCALSRRQAEEKQRTLEALNEELDQTRKELEDSIGEIASLQEQLRHTQHKLSAAEAVSTSIEELSSAELRKELELSTSHSKIEISMLQKEVDMWAQRCNDIEKDLASVQTELSFERAARQQAERAVALLQDRLKEAGLLDKLDSQEISES